MTHKNQKEKRKSDKKSIVDIPKSGYNEEQIETVGETLYKGADGRVYRKVGGSSGNS